MAQPTHRHDTAHRGLVPPAQLGTGTPDGTKFLRDDSTWAAPTSGGTITTKDEGTTLSTGVTTLDFVGAGVTASGAGATTTITIPGGAGGNVSNDGKPYLWTPPSSPNAMDDEFADATGQSGPVNGLNAKWSLHNLSAGYLTMADAVAPGCVYIQIPNSVSVDQYLLQAAPGGDFTVTSRSMIGPSYGRQMVGLIICDVSGNGVACFADNADEAQYRDLASWVQSGGMTMPYAVSGWKYTYGNGAPVTLGIRKSGTSYYFLATLGDRIIDLTANSSANNVKTGKTFTPAYVGFGRGYGTDWTRVALDYFRVV
jgi:hypothetical protein